MPGELPGQTSASSRKAEDNESRRVLSAGSRSVAGKCSVLCVLMNYEYVRINSKGARECNVRAG